MSKNVIQDGYTKEGYIAEETRLHEAMWFKYRPMYGGQTAVFSSNEFRLSPPETQVLLEATAIQKQLVSWSEVDDKGAPLPITAENVRRLPVLVRQRMLNIIAGFSASDVCPGATKTETANTEEDAVRLLEAIATGKSVGEVAAQADAKN